MSSKVQKVLNHLKQFQINKIDKINYYYKIEELRMGTLSVTKVNLVDLNNRNTVLTDEEVLLEFLPEAILQFSNLEIIF